MVQAPPPPQTQSALDALVAEINRFEAIASEWDESQRATVSGLKRAIEALHREALVRIIKSVKQESLSALRQAAEDEVVYGVLCYHDLIKAPQPSLEQRIELALAEVRPGLKSHDGDVELVSIRLPDTVEVRLVGACSHCPASTLTLSEGVEQAIKRYCPEITNVVAVSSAGAIASTPRISPFATQVDEGWREITSLLEVPHRGVLAMKVEGKSLLLSRVDDTVTCFQNACSHLGVPIDSGEVEQGILTCPYHHFQYRLDTGACLTSPETPLQAYPVEVRNGQVFVQLASL